jgi:hypothetical protein
MMMIIKKKNMIKELDSIAWNVTEEEYRADKAYSYSTLSKFAREGFENLGHLFDKVESPSLLFGSLVDALLTGSNDEFNSRFFVGDFPKVSDKQVKITINLFNKHPDVKDLLLIPVNDIIEAAEIEEYQPNWKPITKAESIKKGCKVFYDMLVLADNKTVVNSEDYNEAVECVRVLKESSFTRFFFQANNPYEELRRYYQLKFKSEYHGIPIKCMADLIITDYENKVITPCDLKTSYKPEYKFYKSFIDWNYILQAQLYWHIIRDNLDKDPYFKDFKLNDYKFIVISKGTKTPLVWNFKDTTNTGANIYGKDLQLELPQWRKLLEELHYYLEVNPTGKYPIGIDPNECNDLVTFLNKE